MEKAVCRLKVLVDSGLTARDPMAFWMSRRVLPLQARSHKLCNMSGCHDPTRLSTLGLTVACLEKCLSSVTKLHVEAGWEYGFPGFDREHPTPLVSVQNLSSSCLFRSYPAVV